MPKRLYQGTGTSDTTILQELVFRGDQFANTSNHRCAILQFDESTLAPLAAGSGYRIGLSYQAGSVFLNDYLVEDQSQWSAHYLGAECYFSSRTSGNWTDTPARRLLMAPIFADLAASAGSAGVYRPFRQPRIG